MGENTPHARGDHDLLIKVDTKLDSVIDTVRELKDNIIHRLETVERNKANDCDLSKVYEERESKWNNIDNRLDKLENWRSYIVGTISLIGVLATLITYIYFIRYDFIRADIENIKSNLDKHIEQSSSRQ